MSWLQKLSQYRSSKYRHPEAKVDVEFAKQASRHVCQAAFRRMESMQKSTSQNLAKASETLAETCREWTGREITAEEVQRSAKIGAAIGTVAALGPLAWVAMRQSRAAGSNGSAAESSVGGSGASWQSMAGAPSDPQEAWSQDDLEYDQQRYDQQQYDQLQNHLDHHEQLSDSIDDQVSYNQSLDMGFDVDF